MSIKLEISDVSVTTSSDIQHLHNDISTTLKKISNNTTEVENLVKIIGTPEDSEQLRDRYLRLQNETKALMQQTNNDLKKLPNTPVGTVADQRQKKSLIENLSKQYKTILDRFQEAQRTGARKEKESLLRAQAVSFRQRGTHNSRSDDNSSSANTPYQQQGVSPMERVDMKTLRERDEQLRQLETNILQVNELFKDVARMVHEQDDIIGNISDKVSNAETHVKTATVELKKAVDYRRFHFLFLIIAIFSFFFIFRSSALVIVIIALALGLYFGVIRR